MRPSVPADLLFDPWHSRGKTSANSQSPHTEFDLVMWAARDTIAPTFDDPDEYEEKRKIFRDLYDLPANWKPGDEVP